MSLLISINLIAQNQCEKCDINKLVVVDNHLDSLTYQIVKEFLCTFDDTCKTNSEYSEWSNEILYKVIEKAPEIFFQVITKEQIDNKILLEEIENPILDYDYLKIYNKIKVTKAPKDLKIKYENALLNAKKNAK